MIVAAPVLRTLCVPVKLPVVLGAKGNAGENPATEFSIIDVSIPYEAGDSSAELGTSCARTGADGICVVGVKRKLSVTI